MKTHFAVFRIVCFLLFVVTSSSLHAQAKKPVAASPAKDTVLISLLLRIEKE